MKWLENTIKPVENILDKWCESGFIWVVLLIIIICVGYIIVSLYI